jgi:hypothetical protein
MKRHLILLISAALVAAPLRAAAMQTPVSPAVEATALRELVAAIPLGSRIRVQTSTGPQLTGTLMSVTSDAMVIKRSTRVPEPAVTVPLSGITRLERVGSNGGLSVGKAVGIGLASGAGAILTLIAFAFAMSD